MRLFGTRQQQESKKEAVKIPMPSYRMPVEIGTRSFWTCNRCGAMIEEAELELHGSFHGIQDRLLENLMIVLEKIENADSS